MPYEKHFERRQWLDPSDPLATASISGYVSTYHYDYNKFESVEAELILRTCRDSLSIPFGVTKENKLDQALRDIRAFRNFITEFLDELQNAAILANLNNTNEDEY